MRDVAIIVIMLALIFAAFYRPWLGVLSLAVIGYMNPHKYASEWVANLPLYKIMFVVVALVAARRVLLDRGRLMIVARDWRLLLLALLWCYFALTTSQAVFWIAWPKFVEVSKVLLSLLLTLILIENRRQLLCLLITIAACFALLVLKGGFWALMTGFTDRVYGPPDSHFYDNNHFAVVVVMMIPLLLLWLHATQDRMLRFFLGALVLLSAASALSSWSRGGLLALLATSLALFWFSKRKYVALAAILGGGLLAYQFLPNAWFERMETITAYKTEHSASSRLATWRSGFHYAQDHPLTGAGFDGWKLVNNYTTHIDWHSAYIEILAEHGFIAFGIWVVLLGGTMWSLMRLAAPGQGSAVPGWVVSYCHMLSVSLLGYAVGALFLGIAYWDILYHLIIIAVLVEKFALQEIVQADAANLILKNR